MNDNTILTALFSAAGLDIRILDASGKGFVATDHGMLFLARGAGGGPLHFSFSVGSMDDAVLPSPAECLELNRVMMAQESMWLAAAAGTLYLHGTVYASEMQPDDFAGWLSRFFSVALSLREGAPADEELLPISDIPMGAIRV